MASFIACNKINDLTDTAKVYFKEVMRSHGIPSPIVSDYDTMFLSHFLVTLWKKIGTKVRYSTTCHPQTKGQAKVTNRTLGTLLAALINSNANVWDLLFPHAKFAYNKAPNKTTGISPFQTVHGINPVSPLDLMPRAADENPSVAASKRV